MKRLITLITAATILAPVSVNARTYTTKQLGYSDNLAIYTSKPPKVLIKYFVSYKGSTLKYYNAKYVYGNDSDYIVPVKKVKAFKAAKTTKFYQWDPMDTRKLYLKTNKQFVQYKKKHKEVYLRFKIKNGHATSVLYGPRVWE